MAHAILLSVTIVVTAALIFFGALAIFTGLWRKKTSVDMSMAGSDQDAVFIFRGNALVDCSDPAQKLLTTILESGPNAPRDAAWRAVHAYLTARFPGLDAALSTLTEAGQAELRAAEGGGLSLIARYHKGLTQLRLCDNSGEGSLLAIDRLSFDAMQSELSTLRAVSRHAPALVWKTDASGEVLWANSAYIRALQDDEERQAELSWPLPQLFDLSTRDKNGRLELPRGHKSRWFAHSEAKSEGGSLHFAVPVDAAVQSEALRRETLQTLTRTFASLPIGLALFDSERRLQVFNPALVDLTGMAPLFLAARPSFEQVLYTLREKRMLPEPKDFHNWRREILEMEKAAENGVYAEEWCLDGGRTFHVSGRPQPNGAIALFIEDVTTETALIRNFRAEIETMNKVIDGLDDAVAVFSRTGQTLLANEPYVALWKADPCVDLADGGLTSALGLWSETCEPTTFWARLAEFVTEAQAHDQITGTIAQRSGMVLASRATRLAGGAVMIVFQRVSQSLTVQRLDVRPGAEPEPRGQVQPARSGEDRSYPQLGQLPRRGASERGEAWPDMARDISAEPRSEISVEHRLHKEIISSPDMALRTPEQDSALGLQERTSKDTALRKPRSAVHSGTRLRV